MTGADVTRCHDDACPDAPRCWRYLARLRNKWASHCWSFRAGSELPCDFFIPHPEEDARDEPR